MKFEVVLAALAALLVWSVLMAALYFGDDPPKARALRNAYYPFTVELSVRDL